MAPKSTPKLLMSDAMPDEKHSSRKTVGGLPRYMRLLAFSAICFVALLPSAIVGYFQQYKFAEDTIDQLALHLTTLVHQSEGDSLSPQVAVTTTQNNKLVLWATFLRGDIAYARAGLPPGPSALEKYKLIEIDPKRSISQQFPSPNLIVPPSVDFRLRIPLRPLNGITNTLEIGLSYAALYSLAQDYFALSGLLFMTAFIFLLGAAIFVDVYISRFTMRVIRAIRSNDEPALADLGGIDTLYSPTYSVLMEALERRDDQLIDTRDTLETVFDGIQIGVAMISTETRIVLANQYWLKLISRANEITPEEELISKPCSVLNLPGQSPTVEELVTRALKSLRFESQDVELPYKGGNRYLVQEAYPLFDAHKNPIALIVQCRDITPERVAQLTMQNFNRELQTQLEAQRVKLEETHQKFLQSARLAAVGELAGGVAHEINNPNGVILAGARYVYNRIQNDQTVPDYIPKYLERIIKQSERVADIVRALLTFSRRRPQEKGILHIQDSIDDALELAHSRFGSGKIRFERHIAEDLPFVAGNRNELAQVFLNLLNNAVDAMPNGGEIHLHADLADEDGSMLRLRVRDTGDGIPADLLDKIMEPFFTTKPVGKGTGLGLSISHGIIEEHKGRFRVRNHPDGGAEFEILLPIVSRESPNAN